MTTLELLEHLANSGRVSITGDRYFSYDVTFVDERENLTIAHCAPTLEKAIKAIHRQRALYFQKLGG